MNSKEVVKLKEDLKKSVSAPVKKWFGDKKDSIKRYFYKKTEDQILKLLKKLRPKLKDVLKDPHMWLCVQDFVDDLVDEIWPEIEQEISI